jgi:hypothetical protein
LTKAKNFDKFLVVRINNQSQERRGTLTESKKDLLVKKLQLGDAFTNDLGLKVKVCTRTEIINAKIKKKNGGRDRFKAVICLMVKTENPLMFNENGDPLSGIKTFETYNGFYRITKDGEVNLGKARNFIPATN